MTQPEPSAPLPAQQLLRVAVAQLDFHAAIAERLESPDGEIFLPAEVIPGDAVSEAKALKRRQRELYIESHWEKVRAVLDACAEWEVQALVFPEYSIPSELLARCASRAPQLLLVAGTHQVTKESSRALRELGWQTAARLDQAVCPVLFQGRVVAVIPKVHPSDLEVPWLVPALPADWNAVQLPASHGLSLGVLICLDFFRGAEGLREGALKDCRWLAVPCLTSPHSLAQLQPKLREQSVAWRRPVLFANIARAGGSTIATDSNRGARSDPSLPEELGPDDEAVLVGDLDVGFEATGRHTPYETRVRWAPFAVASLVYAGAEPGYHAWWEKASAQIEDDSGSEEQQLEALEQYVEGAPPGASSGVRQVRLTNLQVRPPRSREAARRALREIILPESTLRLEDLQAALASGAADTLQHWRQIAGKDFRNAARLDAEQSRLQRRRDAAEVRLSRSTPGYRQAFERAEAAARGGARESRPQALLAQNEALLGVVEAGFQQESRQAHEHFVRGRFEDARRVYASMRERAQTSLDRGGPPASMQEWRDKCAINELACNVNLSRDTEARELARELDERRLSPQLALAFAEALALLGEDERTQRALQTAGGTDDPALAIQKRAVEQLLQIERGHVPERLEPKTSVLFAAAVQLALQGRYPRGLECALTAPVADEQSVESSMFNLRRAAILQLILERELFDATPDPQPLTPAQRVEALEATQAALERVEVTSLDPEGESQLKRLSYATSALAQDPEVPPLEQTPQASEDPGNMGVDAAFALAREQRVDEALRALPSLPNPWEGELVAAQLFEAGGQPLQGIERLERLSERYPGRVPIESVLARLLAKVGRFDEAAAHARAAFELFPSLGYRVRWAHWTFYAGRYAEAWDLLQPARDSKQAPVVLLLARVAERAAWHEALGLWKRYGELRPNDPRGWVAQSRILLGLGRFAEGAEAAWTAFELDRDTLEVDELAHCGQAQERLPRDERKREARIRAVLAKLQQRFPGDPQAERCRLSLRLAVGEALEAEPRIDFTLLEKAGHAVPLPVDQLQQWFHEENRRAEALRQLYLAGAIPIALLGDSLHVAQRFVRRGRVTAPVSDATTAEWSPLCPPVALDNPSFSRASDLRDATLLLSDAELLLLQWLGCAEGLVEALGSGRLVIFGGTLERIARSHSSAFRASGWQRVVESLSALREAAVTVTDAPDIVGALRNAGQLDAEQAAQLHLDAEAATASHEVGDVRVPLQLLFRLCSMVGDQALRQTFGERWVRGPDDLALARARLHDEEAHNQAVELVEQTLGFVRRHIDEHVHVISPPAGGRLSSLVRKDGPQASGLGVAALEAVLPYLEALEEHERWWRLSCDHFGCGGFGSPEVTLPALAEPRRGFGILSSAVMALSDRTLRVPQLVRLLSPSPAVAAPQLERLAQLGFADAFDPAALLHLAEGFRGLDRGKPAALLAASEWMAAGHHWGMHSAQVRLATVYAGAAFEAVLGPYVDAGERAELDGVARVEPSLANAIVQSLLTRLEQLGESSRAGVLDLALQFLALRIASEPLRVSGVSGDERTFDSRSPGAVLWMQVTQWCGSDGKRAAARERALADAWLALDQSTAAGPTRVAQAALGLTSRRPHSAPALVSFGLDAVEVIAILSANWEEKPFLHDGLEFEDAEKTQITYEELLSWGARELEAGRVPYDARRARFAWRADGRNVDGSPGRLGVNVQAPIEALLLRASHECLAQHAPQLAQHQGVHDGELARLLGELAARPSDPNLRRDYARRAAGGWWRRVRTDPALLWRLLDPFVTLHPDSCWTELRRILSEPPMSIDAERRALGVDAGRESSVGLAQLLNRRAEIGHWKSRPDAGQLLRQAVQTPGFTGHMVVTALLRHGRVNEELAAARVLVRDSSQVPTSRLVLALLSLRAAAQVFGVLDLAGDRVDLREELAELYASTLEACEPEPTEPSNQAAAPRAPANLAAHESAILRSCREGVGRAALAAGGRATNDDVVWLTYRLYQWLLAQLESEGEGRFRAGLDRLATLAVPVRPAPFTHDFLDPAGFSAEGRDYRLLNVLHAIAASEWLASQLPHADADSADEADAPEPWHPASERLEARLLTIAERAGSGSQQCTMFDWEGPSNAPDLALYALLRLNSAAVTKLSEEALERRIRELPQDLVALGDSRVSTFNRVFFLSLCEHIQGCSDGVRAAFAQYVNELHARHPEHEWASFGSISLFSTAHGQFRERARGSLLRHVSNGMWIGLAGQYLQGIARDGRAALEAETHALIAESGAHGFRAAQVFAALARLAFSGGEEAGAARDILQRVAEHPSLSDDPDVLELLTVLGMDRPAPAARRDSK